MRARNIWARTGTLFILSAFALTLLENSSPADNQRAGSPSRTASSEVFTPAHATMLDAMREFFGRRALVVQPIAFTHKAHLASGLQCTDCHAGVDTGPDARIPSANFCMTCHQVVATDHPEIKRLAAYVARGEDVPWQRVYAYFPSAHVKFVHAPHIRAGINCAQCHGDMRQQTVAVRSVNLSMGYCLDCHKTRKASTDCVTCHY